MTDETTDAETEGMRDSVVRDLQAQLDVMKKHRQWLLQCLFREPDAEQQRAIRQERMRQAEEDILHITLELMRQRQRRQAVVQRADTA